MIDNIYITSAKKCYNTETEWIAFNQILPITYIYHLFFASRKFQTRKKMGNNEKKKIYSVYRLHNTK